MGALLASASVILFANVVARYVFNWSVPWAEELVRYGIIWMVFIGGSVAARKGIHIGIDILATFSPPKIRTVLHLMINAISLLFCLFITVAGFDLISQAKMFGQLAPALQVPIWIIQLAISRQTELRLLSTSRYCQLAAILIMFFYKCNYVDCRNASGCGFHHGYSCTPALHSRYEGWN